MNPLSEEEYYYKLDNMVLISSEHLRSLFQARWKKESGKDWEHSENQGQEFIQGLGQVAYNYAMNAQKGIIAGGKLDDWDISVLSVVLLSFWDWRTYKSVNLAVRQLTNLRNGLAHHPSKKLTLDQYNVKVGSFCSIMKELGVSEEEIEQVIKTSGRSSSVEALKYTKRLYDRARRLLTKNKFEHAIGCYDEAITMPCLLPIHQATAYEKRADCYIKYAQFKKDKHLNGGVDDCCNLALMDADRTLEVNPKSWKALLIKAQGYRLKRDFEKAVELCRESLTISPAEKQVQNELASCLSLSSIGKGGTGHLEPETLPLNLSEKLVQCSEAHGRNVTEQEFLETLGMPSEEAAQTPGHEFYFRGCQYQFGWGVHPNEAKAARYYTKAADLGYAEAIHSLGMFYRTGKGVEQDISKAFELFHKAAHMSPIYPGAGTNTGSNAGVAAAQYDLGVMYANGVTVERDYAQAAKWYGKAAENGDSHAASTMGTCYVIGRGVPKNIKMAVFQWHQAVNFGDAEAAYDLVIHYKDNLEPEKALEMFKTGKHMGCHRLDFISEEEFIAELQMIIDERDYLAPELVSFEERHKLDTRGLTFMERFRRRKNILEGKPPSYIPSIPPVKDLSECFPHVDKTKKWKMAAEKGSIVAAGLLKAFDAGSRVIKLVVENKLSTNEKVLELLNAFYDLLSNEYLGCVLMLQGIDLSVAHKPIEDLFKRHQGKKGDVEMKARLCVVEYNLKAYTGRNIARRLELLKEGIKMYPENVNYYIKLSFLYSTINDFESALTIVEKGLEKFPNNLQLLISHSAMITNLHRDLDWREQVLEVDEEILSKAPKDYPNINWIYYEVANFYLNRMKCKNEYLLADRVRIASYYKQGKEAENRMLSLGLDFVPGDPALEKFLGLEVEGGDKIVKPVPTIPPLQQDETVLQRKPYLQNPFRQRLILWQRELIDMILKEEESVFSCGQTMQLPKMIQTAPKRLFQLKSIKLAGMSSTADDIYQNCFIDLTIIDEPTVMMPLMQLVAEDGNGDTAFVFIHQMEITKINCERLRFGRRICILNPYMQVSVCETESGIRVDDQDCLLFLGGLNDMCRFCGEENASYKCGKCREAMYCSKECQEHDWKILKHKRICSHIKMGNV